jgi:hypothetical protein
MLRFLNKPGKHLKICMRLIIQIVFFFLKSKLLCIKMNINESVSTNMKDKLGDIGEKVSNIDLVTISLNGMLEDYQMFITGFAAREKASTFEELTGILLQEEERRTNLKP